MGDVGYVKGYVKRSRAWSSFRGLWGVHDESTFEYLAALSTIDVILLATGLSFFFSLFLGKLQDGSIVLLNDE